MEEEAQQTRTELGPGGTQQIEGVLESEPSEVCAPFLEVSDGLYSRKS